MMDHIHFADPGQRYMAVSGAARADPWATVGREGATHACTSGVQSAQPGMGFKGFFLDSAVELHAHVNARNSVKLLQQASCM